MRAVGAGAASLLGLRSVTSALSAALAARAAALSTCRSYTLPSAGARTCVDAARRPRIRTRAGASRSMAPATHMNKYRTDRYVPRRLASYKL